MSGREGSEAGVMTCSICLQQTDLEQIASVKDCDHTYCGEPRQICMFGVFERRSGRAPVQQPAQTLMPARRASALPSSSRRAKIALIGHYI